jgi:tetratricopeptide (TPR) repeat protein
MAEGEVQQYFVRNDKGTIWGPLTLPTIELLIENGVIQGRLQVSEDGLNFAFPGRFPHLRDAFPRELWGDVIAEGETVKVARAELPPELLGQSAPVPPGAPGPGVPSAAPMAGPGAIAQAAAPRAGPGAIAQAAAPRAGPGAIAQAAASRAGPGAIAQAAAPRPGPGAIAQATAPMAGPGARAAATPSGAMPGRPSSSSASAPPPGAGPRPPPIMTPAAGIPGGPAAPGRAPPAGAAPRPPPVMTPSGPPSSAPEPGAPAPPAQGSLEQLSPIALYGRIAAGGHTGLLTLTLPDRSIQLHFRKGSPEFVDSSHAEDSLGTVLLQAKLLTPEQLQQAETARDRFGGDLLAALFGLGVLQPANAFGQLSQRALSILHKGLRAEAGAFTYEPKDLPAAKAMPLGNRWAVLSDQIRRFPSVDLKRRLQPVLNLPIMKSGGLVPTSDLRLTPHEVRVLASIDGVRSLAQLLTDFPQDSEHILRLALLLKELDGVSFAAVAQRPGPPPPEARAAPSSPPPAAAAPRAAAANPPPAAARHAAPHPPPAAAARPAPAPAPAPAAAAARPAAPHPPPAAARHAAPVLKPAAPAPAPSAPRPAAPQPSAPAAATAPASAPGAEALPALRETAATMKKQNFFERLGLTEQADGGAAKLAYFKLARLYHPDTLPPGAPPELEKLKAEIFGYIGDAYRTLTDDKSRKDYIEQLKGGAEGQAEVDVVAILQAEERFKRGTVFMKARKYAEAVTIFDEAIQLNAEEPEFYAWRGYAKFCAAADKKAAQPEAFREIQVALKKNDRCAPAHYFLGVMAKTLGDSANALKHFRKTVELQPDHIDAQREIRMAAQKK